jgi:hypothetical protein
VGVVKEFSDLSEDGLVAVWGWGGSGEGSGEGVGRRCKGTILGA